MVRQHVHVLPQLGIILPRLDVAPGDVGVDAIGELPLAGRPSAVIRSPSTFVISMTTRGLKTLLLPASLQIA
jgi:hypothetical protein